MPKYCSQCGAELRETAMFCPSCGAKTRRKKEEEKRTYFDMGKMILEENVGNSMPDAIMSPIKTFTSVLSRIESGLANLKRKPLAVMPAILFFVLWLILLICRSVGIDNPITAFLSFMSYGGDVSDRSLLGVLGSAVGRGTVAMAFASLFTGGLKNLRSGFSKCFPQKGQTPIYGGMGWFLTGVGSSLIVSRILQGTPVFSRVMAVVSLAIVSVQALGNEKSWMFSMARSVTAIKRPDGIRIADFGAARMIMTGFIAGFALMTVFSAENSFISLFFGDTFLSVLPTVVGVILLIVGIIMPKAKR